MDRKILLKQMIDFNQAAFNNAFSATVLVQDQLEKMATMQLSQSDWLPEEGRKAIEEWVRAYQTGRDQYKTSVDDAYQKVQAFFSK